MTTPTVDFFLADAIKWANEYQGEPFHALLCDAPYHLTSITERFGKRSAADVAVARATPYRRTSTGFMGAAWDGGDVAFRPETWAAYARILYPGAFIAAFAGSRGWHRMAVAMEDSGLIIHPTVFLWAQSQGFPKGTRIDKRVNPELARAWSGHRYGVQALKPAVEPIIIAQVPYSGRAIDNIAQTGAGALNIDAARVENDGQRRGVWGTNQKTISKSMFNNRGTDFRTRKHDSGRWPGNFILSHSPECDGDGCAPGCPVRAMGGDGVFFERVAGAIDAADPVFYCPKASTAEREAGLDGFPRDFLATMGDGIGEREHNAEEPGAWRANTHPTVKPIALARYIARLLLPPDEYAPRRLFVPFAGVGSECIGAAAAGWEYVAGVELDGDARGFGKIARARIEHYVGRGAVGQTNFDAAERRGETQLTLFG